jgi:hypothetical protein
MAKTTKPKTKTPPTRKGTSPNAAAKGQGREGAGPPGRRSRAAPTTEMPRWRS